MGSIFRTADTLGISKIYCLGTTPVPNDRFGRKRKDFSKVSLGAEDSVMWEHVGTIAPNTTLHATHDKSDTADAAANNVSQTNSKIAIKLVNKLKREGYKVVALEQSDKSVDYKDVDIGHVQKTLIILGNEVEGVNKKLLELSDVIAEIQMIGKKESLNVSIAGAVFLYRLLDRA